MHVIKELREIKYQNHKTHLACLLNWKPYVMYQYPWLLQEPAIIAPPSVAYYTVDVKQPTMGITDQVGFLVYLLNYASPAVHSMVMPEVIVNYFL